MEKYGKFMPKIIKIQARYRGYLARKQYAGQIKANLMRKEKSKAVNTTKKAGAIQERTYEDGSKYKGTQRFPTLKK